MQWRHTHGDKNSNSNNNTAHYNNTSLTSKEKQTEAERCWFGLSY